MASLSPGAGNHGFQEQEEQERDSPPSLRNRSDPAPTSASSHAGLLPPAGARELLLPPARSQVAALPPAPGFSALPAPFCSLDPDLPERALETLGRAVPLHHDGLVTAWPGVGGGQEAGSGGGRSRRQEVGGAGGRRCRVQTVSRPPSRQEVERWGRVRLLLKQEKQEKEVPLLEQTQRVRIRVRRDSEDSVGSELTCSLPSSPDRQQEAPTMKQGSPATKQESPAPFSPLLSVTPESCRPRVKRRRISWELSDSIPCVLNCDNSVLDVEEVKLSDSEERDYLEETVIDFEEDLKVDNDGTVDSPLMFDSPTPTLAQGKAGAGRQEQEQEKEQEGPINATLGLLASPTSRARFVTPRVRRGRPSGIQGTTPSDTPQTRVDLGAVAGHCAPSHLTLLALEVQCSTRGALRPDPEFDPIEAVFYRVVVEGEDVGSVGVVVVEHSIQVEGLCGVRRVKEEQEVIRSVVRLVRDVDPDILGGWEVQMSSWGYLLARAAVLGTNLCPLLSRVPSSVRESKMPGLLGDEDKDNPGVDYQATTTSEICLVGRTVFNVWRMLRAELALYSYTLENIAKVVLGERRPAYTDRVLAQWWGDHRLRPRVVEHQVGRLQTMAAILSRLDLLSRSSELARLFGIQLSEVFSRGSQFRVESSMLRLAKPSNFVPVSPTRQQLAGQAAPEYLALLLEPESKMYTDPVVVLDFASLYPSIMIAHNYCFTTCLGRLQKLSLGPGAHEFGCTQLRVSTERLKALEEQGMLTVSPGGVVFLKRAARRGVLPQMLEDILGTRCMVKASMKKHKSDPQLQKLLHSRQLGLKLIANVTYGYTSANFSGRMPCIEVMCLYLYMYLYLYLYLQVGDSVVSKGREALERTIRTIETHQSWGGKVRN